MATKTAYKRLTKEYMAIQKNPPPYITAKPCESDILEWHYVITGPPDSPYAGQYHGRLNFPPDYPFKPPSIRMFTPNGRFQQNTRLCLTMSDYHPNTWNPAWSVSTILTGLLSFMLETTPTTGSISTSDADKRTLAKRSHEWNASNPRFKELFPELVQYTQPTLPAANETEGLKKRTTTDSQITSTENAQTQNIQRRPRSLIRSCTSLIKLVLIFIVGYVLLLKVLSRAMASLQMQG